MATIDELRALAREIREERQIGGNTGARVGNTFDKVADLLESTGGDISDIREAVEQLLQDVGFIPRDISRTATDAVFTNSEGELLFWLRAATDTLAGLITAANNNKLIALPTAEELAQALAAKQNRLTFDPRPIEGSTNPVTSDGINTAIANFVTRSVSDLIYYYTKSETYTKEEVNALVAAIKQFVPVVAQTLPTPSADTMYKLYLIPSEDPQESNIKDEYITIDNGVSANPRYTWEKIGSVDIDISGKADIGTVPADVTRTQTDATFVNSDNEPLFYLRQASDSLAGLMTAAEHNKLDALPTAQDLNTSLDSIIYDVSAKNPTAGPNNDGKFTLAYILNPSNVNTLIPTAYRKGGMSIKFVQTYDNKYVRCNLLADEFSTDVEDWEHAASVEDLENGNIIPAMAETLEPWADQKAIATPDTYTDAVRTTGGDIPVETSAGSKPESIKPVAGSKWTAKMLFNGSYNMLNAAKWGAANSQPYVGGVGGDFVYFLVPELTLGTFGTADENNGLLFTNAQGENVEPTSVYFKPLGATVPQSLTDGTSITPTSVSYDGKTYEDYATSGAGWLIIPKTYYDNDVCAHIAWEDWYDKHVSLDAPNNNPEAVVGILMLEGLLALAHSDKYLRGINESVCDNAVFGDTSSTITHMVDELSVAANAWTNAATGESDSHGNALYRHSATVSLIKQGGAACIDGEDGGIPLTVNGTTVSYVDTNTTAPASVVFYEVTAISTTKAYTDSVFSGSNINTETGILPINDCSIEAQVAMDGKADITVKYAKNIVDQVAINATVDVPQIKRQVEDHEERIEELEDTAVRTGSYDASVSVGLADNFRGDTIVDAEFYKRNTGGTQSVGSGIAAIKEMRGKSIVWNQLLKNGNFTTKWGIRNGTSTLEDNVQTITKNDGAASCQINVINPAEQSTHIFLSSCWVKQASATTGTELLGGKDRTIATSIATTSWQKLANVWTGNLYGFYLIKTSNSDAVQVKNAQLFDLTLMFGEGNEPATVAEFEKMFPLDYYDYKKGTVLPFAAQNLTTTGKNQYNPATGKANLLGGQTYQIGGTYTKIYPTVTLVDYTYGSPVESGTYYTNANSHYVGTKAVSAYDNTKTYALGAYCVNNDTIYKSNVAIETAEEFDSTKWDIIADVAAMVTEGIFTLWDIIPDANGLFTLTKDTEVTIVGGNDTDTMIAIYGGESVAYEPYEKHTLPLDPSQWRDKQGNLVFPYGGMFGYGIAYDYAKVDADGYIRKAMRVYERRAYESGDVTDGNIITDGRTYTFYPLAEPIEVELATPVYAKYLVDKDGTEEITPANGTTPYTTMANLSILYAMDARGEIKNLPKNYLSKESAENMLNAMVSAGVISSYTMTWDAANNRYAFVIAATIEPEPAQSNN